MRLKRPDPEPRVEFVVDKIQSLIRSGELKPGDRLLPERQLAEELGVSRGSVRAALAKLAGMGIIEISPREGARVRRRQLDDAVAPLSEFLVQEQQSVFHLLEVRRLIETRAAELAALRADEADILHLRQATLKLENDFRNGRDTGESDTAFHLALVACTKNPLLVQVMQVVVSAMNELYGSTRHQMMENEKLARDFIAEHHALVEAIANRDTVQAAALVEQHIDHAAAFIDEAIQAGRVG